MFRLHLPLSFPRSSHLLSGVGWRWEWGIGTWISLESPCCDEPQLLLLMGVYHPSGEKGQEEKLRTRDTASGAISSFLSVQSPSLEDVHWGFHSGATGALVLIILYRKMGLSSSKQLIEDSCPGQMEQ